MRVLFHILQYVKGGIAIIEVFLGGGIWYNIRI